MISLVLILSLLIRGIARNHERFSRATSPKKKNPAMNTNTCVIHGVVSPYARESAYVRRQ